MSTARPLDRSPATRTVAALLHEFGQGFDTEQVSAAELVELAAGWVRHFLDGAPSPCNPELGEGWRDWPGVHRFLAERRADERKFVGSSTTTLRALVWEVVNSLMNTVEETSTSDQELRAQLERLRVAATSSTTSDLRAEVLGTVSVLNQHLEQRIARQQEQLRDLGARLVSTQAELREARQAASTDGLTRVFNRAAFDHQLTRTAQIASLSRQPASLVLIDLDHFKRINDAHGHPFGDTVLRAVADLLVASFPRRTDFVARYGGEEFAVLLAGENRSSAQRLAERFLLRLRMQPVADGATQAYATASIGVTEWNRGDSPATWLARADAALYAAKEGGRDRVSSA